MYGTAPGTLLNILNMMLNQGSTNVSIVIFCPVGYMWIVLFAMLANLHAFVAFLIFLLFFQK